MVLAWVALYTVGLRSEVATSRRAEIESDLWESSVAAMAHGPPGRVAPARLSRLVRGIPADLAWRIDQRTEERPREIVMRPSILEWVLLAIAGALCLVSVYGGVVGIVIADPTRWDSWGPYGALVAGLIGLVGLGASIRRSDSRTRASSFSRSLLGALAMPWLWPFATFVLLAAFVAGRSCTKSGRPRRPDAGAFLDRSS